MNQEANASADVPAVRLKNIRRRFGKGAGEIEVLRGIDLDIHRGDFAAIAGPSGSGKTTLLNIIGALDLPTEGTVHIDGVDIATLSLKERAHLRRDRIGFVFQSYNLMPVLTAMENAEYVLALRGVPRESRRATVSKLLDAVGLEGLESRFPNQLSGGQQQRVAIARALAAEPSLIIADEPTANVDARVALDLVALMRKLHAERGATFFMATHDLRVMRRCDRLLWIEEGEITYDGPPSGFELPE